MILFRSINWPACPRAHTSFTPWRKTLFQVIEPSYILTSADPNRPELNRAVKPGWPFADGPMDIREGRIEAFANWLTASKNPLFARVAVNRLWQWHFGSGLHKQPSDFGTQSPLPLHRDLLDWLASEFISGGYSVRYMATWSPPMPTKWHRTLGRNSPNPVPSIPTTITTGGSRSTGWRQR